MAKSTIKLNENTLKKMIAESVTRVLKEEYDWNHYNDGPSQEEETFQDELYSVIEEYGLDIARVYGNQNFIKWCVEIINRVLNDNKNKLKPGIEQEPPMRGEY
jgi:hypothetical protein